MLTGLAAVARLSALAPGLGGKIAVAREAAVFVRDVLSALAAGLSGEFAVLAEAPFFVRYAWPPFEAIARCFAASMEAKPRLEVEPDFLGCWEAIITPVLLL